MAARGQADLARRVLLTGVPVVAGDDRIRQLQAGYCRVEGAEEDRGRRPVRPDVVGDRGAGNLHGAVRMEDGPAMPAGGRVAAERAVGDLDAAQRAETTPHV